MTQRERGLVFGLCVAIGVCLMLMWLLANLRYQSHPHPMVSFALGAIKGMDASELHRIRNDVLTHIQSMPPDPDGRSMWADKSKLPPSVVNKWADESPDYHYVRDDSGRVVYLMLSWRLVELYFGEESAKSPGGMWLGSGIYLRTNDPKYL